MTIFGQNAKDVVQAAHELLAKLEQVGADTLPIFTEMEHARGRPYKGADWTKERDNLQRALDVFDEYQ